MKRDHRIKAALVIALTCGSGALANDATPYPKARVAEFVVDTLDATSLPSPFRPQRKEGGKTFTNDGYSVARLGENEATLKAPGKEAAISIRILEQTKAGIYACMTTEVHQPWESKVQTVVLLRRKNSDALLKARESAVDFDSCPVMGRLPLNAGE